MGEVYRARDTRLDRLVAVKVLPERLLQDPGRRQRLEREARAISALSHPHICTLHDVGHQDGIDYLVMEHLEGETLAARLQRGPLPLDEALRHAAAVARALDAAHRHGIVHRDLKPGNVMITPVGAKLLDFGLAKVVQEPASGAGVSAAPTVRPDSQTATDVMVGTPAYMSPEQATGSPVDPRTDVYAFGLVLYEMLTGRRAVAGQSHAETLAAILRDDPAPIRSVRPEIGTEIQEIVSRCLRKDPAERYPDAAALAAALEASSAPATAGAGRRRLRPLILVPALLALAGAVALSGWMWRLMARERWARRTAMPEIARLAENDQAVAAFRLALQVLPVLSGDPAFDKLWRDVAVPVSLATEPAGAEVSFRSYGDPAADWVPAGRTPLKEARVPFGQLRWRIALEGYEPVHLVFNPGRLPPSLKLVPVGEAPPGMIRVPGGQYAYRNARAGELQDYWLDRFEVTNRQFKQFVDQGGYGDPRYWKHPFVRNGRTLSFQEAMAGLRDATGRPGPSTWELGDHPPGQADHPVSGVSWYEAAAYAQFAGKSLPTFHHWFRAAGADDIFSGIVVFSNFSGEGPATVGSNEGLSPWGAHDMAGNVREWAFNAAGPRRYSLGGAWSDPTYLFTGPDALDPFDRSPIQGFRCALYPDGPSQETLGPIETVFPDYSTRVPVEDAVFEAYRGLHRYDPGPIDARLESVDKVSEFWTEEHISYAGAAGGERIPATLYLPKSVNPPYQAVLYFPPGSARRLHSVRDAGTRQFAFLVRSGRAVLFPSYKGTFERRLPAGGGGLNAWRDLVIQWSKEVGRSLDYLQSRPDIEAGRIAYHGLSMGAGVGPIFAAVEPRIRAMVLVGGGLSTEEEPPEADPFHFAPRARVPILMINGTHDFIFPLEASQRPLFRLLPLPDGEKRHHVFDGGHVPPRMQEVARETLDWLDRHLGPVDLSSR